MKRCHEIYEVAGRPEKSSYGGDWSEGPAGDPRSHEMFRQFVKTIILDSDFRKSVFLFLIATILGRTGRAFGSVREAGVKAVRPVVIQTRRFKWKSPWLSLTSAFVEFLIAALMLPLESINLLGYLLEAADEKLRVAGNRYIDRWIARLKSEAAASH